MAHNEIQSSIDENNKIIINVDSRIFSREAVLKCLYWYSDKFEVKIFLNQNDYTIIFKPISVESNIDLNLEDYRLKLLRDLIDFNLRDIVTKETKNIRDLLIAKAFSHGEYEELPPGFVSDPVGFKIEEIIDVE